MLLMLSTMPSHGKPNFVHVLEKCLINYFCTCLNNARYFESKNKVITETFTDDPFCFYYLVQFV